MFVIKRRVHGCGLNDEVVKKDIQTYKEVLEYLRKNSDGDLYVSFEDKNLQIKQKFSQLEEVYKLRQLNK